MKCKDVEKLLTLYHDGELSPKERSTFERHLAKCPACRAKLEKLKALDELVRDGEAERVPDPGHHYWSSFALRVTKRLQKPHTHLIRRPRPKLFSWRLLPYLSAGVAVVIAIVIVFPLLKQSPTKFKGEEGVKIESQASDLYLEREAGESTVAPSSPAARDHELAISRTDAGAKESGRMMFQELDETADLSAKTSGHTPVGLGRASSEEAEGLEAPTVTEEIGTSSRQGARSTAAEKSALPSSAERVPQEGTGAVFYVGDEDRTPGSAVSADYAVAMTGTLKVAIDSLGRLADVGIESSSGNARFDSLAIARYKAENKNKTFRQRKAILYVPFTSQSE